MKVPPLDLSKEYQSIQNEVESRLKRVLASGRFILGQEVSKFEDRFARFIGTKYCVAVASGSDALLLSLIALGIGKGDEVITTPLTFIATATAIARTGATPVFVDIDPKTFNLNPKLIQKKIIRKTKAILPVHLYGAPCDISAINSIARKHGLFVIEDCAQSAGAKWKGKHTGSFGDFGAFSFYPTKNLGAYGDAGAITTNHAKFNALLRSLRNHGADQKKYHHDRIGANSRLDEIQAAILNVKLKYIDQWNKTRRQIAARYHQLFRTAKIREVQITENVSESVSVFHQYTILVEQRDSLLRFLNRKGIAASVYYPTPLHLQPCFRNLGYWKGDLPETEKAVQKILQLPIYPALSASAQRFIVSKVRQFFS